MKEWFKSNKAKEKKDGSGKGIRANKGRGGCINTELIGKGRKNESKRI